MAVRECVVCGALFRKWANQKYCSDDCFYYMKNKKRREEYKACLKVLACEECGTHFNPRGPQVTCSRKCAKLRNRRRSKDHYRENSEEYKYRSSWKNLSQDRRDRAIMWNKNNPQAMVKSHLKKQLGFTPPPDLVEEATALRVLNRAIRKAGE